MPPNFQRFLPLLLLLFVVLIIVPALFRKSSSSGPTSATISTETITATNLVDQAEVQYRAAHGGYSDHLADLLALKPKLGRHLADGISIQLDTSSDGRTYLAQVSSSVIALVRARSAGKTITRGCLVIKNSSGVDCPGSAAKTGTITTTGGTTTTGTTG